MPVACHKVAVRMAERSKAPDSRGETLSITEHSGPQMWAWVRIPLLTLFIAPVDEDWDVDKIVLWYLTLHQSLINLALKISTEPDLNQRPKDNWQYKYYVYSPPLYQLSYRWSRYNGVYAAICQHLVLFLSTNHCSLKLSWNDKRWFRNIQNHVIISLSQMQYKYWECDVIYWLIKLTIS